ncbi:PRC-barrel domain-containing protein [Paraburkholderia sediminicola]|uniref:PRC-barrel domain-containing protein n=1 Tax=Paraburkholderia sediminicola TaxID=458836 RepID=UPI0038B92FD2
MIQRITTLASAGLLCAILAIGALAQGAPQSITERRTDVVQLSAGYRASRLQGAAVYNRDKDRIGKVDDLVVAPKDSSVFAILSVGGFLGVGKHLVAVPFSDLQIDGRQLILPDATTKSLEALPEFKYAPE